MPKSLYLKHVKSLLLLGILFLTSVKGLSQQFEFKTSELPRYRNGKDAIMADDGSMIIVGGWLRNDSISGIYRSTDTNQSWNIIKDELGPMFNSIIQLDANKFLALGRSGRMASSTDKGLKWFFSQISNLASVEFTHGAFPTSQKGLIIGWDDQKQKTLILRTINGAKNFEIVLDSALGKPNSIITIDSMNYWVITVNGFILHTSNAGNNWTIIPNSTANNRIYNSISPISNEQFMIAGCEIIGNDTHQTIWMFDLKSKSTSNLFALKGFPFTQVRFMNGESYLLSQNGGFFYSNDTCKTIKSVNLPNQSSDNRVLNTIRLINPGTGIICGNQGRTLYFINNDYKIPTGQIDRIFVTKKLEVKVKSSIQPKGLKPKCYLIFENSKSNKDSIFLGQIDGFDKKEILSYLQLNEDIYTFKIVGYYQNNSFHSKQSRIDLTLSQFENMDFENWDNIETKRVQNWNTVGNAQPDSTLQYILLKSVKQDEPGGVFLASINQDSIRGGIPIKNSFDTLYLKCKYQIASNDSAYISLRFKNSSLHQFHRIDFRWSGNSSKDTLLKFATQVPSISYDSLILIILTTDYFNNKVDTNSFMWLDSIWTNNISNPFENAGFSHWHNLKAHKLSKWSTLQTSDSQELIIEPSIGYNRNSTSVMFSLNNNRNQGRLYYGRDQTDSSKFFPPKVKISSNYKSIHGYFKFLPITEQDTLFFEIYVFSDTQIIGQSKNFITQKTEEWNTFEFPINYFSNENATDIAISFGLTSGTSTNSSDKAIAFLDDFNFDYLLDSNFIASKISPPIHNNSKLLVYPNPTEHILHLQLSDAIDILELKIHAINGSSVLFKTNTLNKNERDSNQTNDHMQIDCSNLPNGVYFGEIIHASGKNLFKFQVIK